jgi:hypothetical protein
LSVQRKIECVAVGAHSADRWREVANAHLAIIQSTLYIRNAGPAFDVQLEIAKARDAEIRRSAPGAVLGLALKTPVIIDVEHIAHFAKNASGLVFQDTVVLAIRDQVVRVEVAMALGRVVVALVASDAAQPAVFLETGLAEWLVGTGQENPEEGYGCQKGQWVMPHGDFCLCGWG